MNSQKMDTQTCRLLLIENKADLDIKDVSIRDVLNSLMWDGMPKAHHICSCVRSPYRFLKFNAATKQPNAPFTLQHIRSAFSHKNL